MDATRKLVQRRRRASLRERLAALPSSEANPLAENGRAEVPQAAGPQKPRIRTLAERLSGIKAFSDAATVTMSLEDGRVTSTAARGDEPTTETAQHATMTSPHPSSADLAVAAAVAAAAAATQGTTQTITSPATEDPAAGTDSAHRSQGVLGFRPLTAGLSLAALAVAGLAAYFVAPPSVFMGTPAGLAALGGKDPARQLAQTRRAKTPAPVPLPNVKIALASDKVAATVGKAAPVPLVIDNPALVPPRSFVLVRGMPERAMLSAGHPLGAGTWIVKPDSLHGLSLTIFSDQVVAPRLGVELLSDQGEVISTSEATVVLAQAQAARKVEKSAVATYPPLKAEAADKSKQDRPTAVERPSPKSARQAAKAPAAKNTAATPPPKQTITAAATPTLQKSAQWQMNWNSLATGR